MFQYKNQTPIEVRPGKWNHIAWIDPTGTGIWEEVAVVNIDNNGNVHHIPLSSLDQIDKRRLFDIISNRQATLFPLYELFAQKTLGNAMNALEYFQQVVKILTPSGQVLTPRLGQVGGAAAQLQQIAQNSR
jgi:hypothetical protein